MNALRFGSLAPVWIAVLSGCGGGEPAAPETPSNQLREVALLTDLNPDPNVVEVELVAGLSTMEYLKGKTAEVWAYRDGALQDAKGTVPGPMLQAKVGDEVIVHFRNDLGDPKRSRDGSPVSLARNVLQAALGGRQAAAARWLEGHRQHSAKV